GEPRCHGRCTRPPQLACAHTVGRHQLRQRLAQGSMRQAEIIVHMIQCQLLAYTILAFTQGAHPSADCRHMLANGQVQAVTVDRGIAPSTSASKPCVPLFRHTPSPTLSLKSSYVYS